MDRKDIFMSGFKSKIGYSFTYKDLNEFEAIIDFYEQQCKKQKEIIDIQKENEQLKDNWNKLKEYIKETKLKEFEKSYGKRYGKTFTQAEIIVCNMILDKMKELEGSDSNVKN